MEQVTSNIYTETKIRGCNPSIVFTSEGSVFVDTAQLLSKLLEMRKFALERGPIRYLINTEAHIDHKSLVCRRGHHGRTRKAVRRPVAGPGHNGRIRLQRGCTRAPGS